MDFGLSTEQEMLRTQARAVLGRECPIAFVRKAMEDPVGDPSELWQKMAELGWMGVLIPEVYGGIGLTLIEQVIVLEEMGRILLPGPYFATVLLGGLSLLTAGEEEHRQTLLPRLAAGTIKMTLAITEESGRWEAVGIRARATAKGKGYVLNGTKLFVPDAHVADYLIWAARTRERGPVEEGITLFLLKRDTRGLTCTQVPTMDRTRRFCNVTVEGVRVGKEEILGPLHGGWPLLQQVMEMAMVGLCAEMVGGAERVLEMATEYAKTRVAFGKPIGTYQAVKHKCADMLVGIENAKSLTYYAAWATRERVPEASLAASMAKAYATDMYCKVVRDGIQIHGGIGFTWEHDMHLYFKRAQSARFILGDATWHRDYVARQLAAPTG